MSVAVNFICVIKHYYDLLAVEEVHKFFLLNKQQGDCCICFTEYCLQYTEYLLIVVILLWFLSNIVLQPKI